MKKHTVVEWLCKIFTHNKCDTCGFTKDEVFIIDYYTESALIQCIKCQSETYKNTNE